MQNGEFQPKPQITLEKVQAERTNFTSLTRKVVMGVGVAAAVGLTGLGLKQVETGHIERSIRDGLPLPGVTDKVLETKPKSNTEKQIDAEINRIKSEKNVPFGDKIPQK